MIQHAEKLGDVHQDLRAVMLAVGQRMDILIAVGHRDEAAQKVAFESGKSEVPFPKSKHNSLPALAVDVVPLPVNWKDIAGFQKLADIVAQEADRLGVEVVWGGSWRTLKDYDHWEIVGDPGDTTSGGTSTSATGGVVSA